MTGFLLCHIYGELVSSLQLPSDILFFQRREEVIVFMRASSPQFLFLVLLSGERYSISLVLLIGQTGKCNDLSHAIEIFVVLICSHAQRMVFSRSGFSVSKTIYCVVKVLTVTIGKSHWCVLQMHVGRGKKSWFLVDLFFLRELCPVVVLFLPQNFSLLLKVFQKIFTKKILLFSLYMSETMIRKKSRIIIFWRRSFQNG